MGNEASLVVFLVATGVLFAMRKSIGLFWSATLFYAATVLYIMYGLTPPTPGSVVSMYAATALLATVLYVTSSESARKSFWGPIEAIMVEPRLRPVLMGLLVLVPGAVAWQAYEASLPPTAPPPKVRSVHPSPPASIKVAPPKGKEGKARTIDLVKDDSPYVDVPETDAFYAERSARGKVVYYENCYYCHGDNLEADGHYADALKPPPANFRDPGVIPMLENTFLFWRIAKGGPGLPAAGTPWDSGMPIWDVFLSEDDMWAVIVFMSDFSGYKPRAKEQHE